MFMKKIVKRVILVFVLILVIALGIAAYNFYPMLIMKPAQTGGIPDTNIFAAKNNMNAVYFVDTGDGYIMIDAGSDVKALETVINDAGIGADDVKWVLLTHSDYDHVASLPLFPNAEIYISENEIPLLNGTVKRNAASYNSLPAEIGIDDLAPLQDGQELSFAGTAVKCLGAPGHTNGSMLYLIDGKYLFTGDVFKVDNEKLGVHPYTMDEETAKKTIESLKDTINGNTLVITAHYGYFEGDRLS